MTHETVLFTDTQKENIRKAHELLANTRFDNLPEMHPIEELISNIQLSLSSLMDISESEEIQKCFLSFPVSFEV
jgi:hypothetical protein